MMSPHFTWESPRAGVHLCEYQGSKIAIQRVPGSYQYDVQIDEQQIGRASNLNGAKTKAIRSIQRHRPHPKQNGELNGSPDQRLVATLLSENGKSETSEEMSDMGTVETPTPAATPEVVELTTNDAVSFPVRLESEDGEIMFVVSGRIKVDDISALAKSLSEISETVALFRQFSDANCEVRIPSKMKV